MAKANLFDRGVQLVKQTIPGFEIRYKNEAWSSKVIAALVWLFNRDYLTRYTTTRYPRVYFPSKKFVSDSPTTAFKILMHEFVHLWDRKTQGWFRFTIGYAFPQILAVVFLLILVGALVAPTPGPAAWIKWLSVGIGAVGFFVSVLPLPASWRTRAELRGYAMNLAVNFWRYGSINNSTLEWIVEHFTGWPYFKMWPYENDARRRLVNLKLAIEDGRIRREDLEGGSPIPFALTEDLIKDLDK
jgi:hypothetical protein